MNLITLVGPATMFAITAIAFMPVPVLAQDLASGEQSLPGWLVSMFSAILGGIGWRVFKDSHLPFTEPAKQVLNPAIADDTRRTLTEAIRLARQAAGGPAGRCEVARLSICKSLGKLVSPLNPECVVGRGSAAFQHEISTLTNDVVVDPVARQAVARRLTTWRELRARGLEGAVQEGIFTAEQWQQFRRTETTPAGPRAERIAKLGKVLVAIGALIAVLNVALAPEDQREIVLSQEAGAWAGSFAVAWGAAKLGVTFFGPPGALIGAIIGAVIGGLLGSIAGGRAYNAATRPPEVAQFNSAPAIDCDCEAIGDAGPLTITWQQKCLGQEQAIREKAGSARTIEDIAAALGLEADQDGKITLSGGYYCWPAGPNAWPAVGAPIAGPPRPQSQSD